ncbi:MAG: hypothetical protein H7199_00935 [Burkholderiales bacterium]|nr:hypothetical protein [Flavobacterium sp.]
MKNVKVFLATSVLSLIFNAATAQEKQKLSDEKKQEMVKQKQENKDLLGLTNEQQIPFRAITKRYAQRIKDLRGSSSDRKQKMDALKDIMSDKNGEMKTLLSEKQYEIYLQLQEERKTKILQNKER